MSADSVSLQTTLDLEQLEVWTGQAGRRVHSRHADDWLLQEQESNWAAPGGRCAGASASTPPACLLPRSCRKGWVRRKC
jgi:hypothetical protein